MKLPSAVLTNRLLEIGRIVDRPPARLHLHGDDFVLDEQVGGLLEVDHGVDQARDLADRHAEFGRRLAIDADGKLRLRGVVIGARVAEARRLRQAVDHLAGRVRQPRVVRARNRKAQALPATADAEAVAGADRDRKAGDVGELLLQFRLDLLLRARALAPWRKRRHDRCAVRAASADGCEHTGDLARLLVFGQDVFHLVRLLRHVIEVCALLCRQPDLHDAAILGGRDFVRQQLERGPAEGSEREASERPRASAS